MADVSQFSGHKELLDYYATQPESFADFSDEKYSVSALRLDRIVGESDGGCGPYIVGFTRMVMNSVMGIPDVDIGISISSIFERDFMPNLMSAYLKLAIEHTSHFILLQGYNLSTGIVSNQGIKIATEVVDMDAFEVNVVAMARGAAYMLRRRIPPDFIDEGKILEVSRLLDSYEFSDTIHPLFTGEKLISRVAKTRATPDSYQFTLDDEFIESVYTAYVTTYTNIQTHFSNIGDRPTRFISSWYGDKAELSHAIMVYLKKQPDEKFNTLILNTGGGIAYNFWHQRFFAPISAGSGPVPWTQKKKLVYQLMIDMASIIQQIDGDPDITRDEGLLYIDSDIQRDEDDYCGFWSIYMVDIWNHIKEKDEMTIAMLGNFYTKLIDEIKRRATNMKKDEMLFLGQWLRHRYFTPDTNGELPFLSSFPGSIYIREWSYDQLVKDNASGLKEWEKFWDDHRKDRPPIIPFTNDPKSEPSFQSVWLFMAMIMSTVNLLLQGVPGEPRGSKISSPPIKLIKIDPSKIARENFRLSWGDEPLSRSLREIVRPNSGLVKPSRN